MSAWTPEDERAILDSIENWVEKEVRPVAQKFDQADEYPHALVEQMKELGLFGATIGQAHGGMGLPASTYAKIVIKVASAWMAPSGIFNSHLIMASAIERFGTDAQKAEFLPRMARGEVIGAIAMTEPCAGSDLQGTKTTARRDGDQYVLNGSKTLITNGSLAGVLCVVVKTDPKAAGLNGMSLILVETKDLAGFRVGRTLEKLGPAYARQTEVAESANAVRVRPGPQLRAGPVPNPLMQKPRPLGSFPSARHGRP